MMGHRARLVDALVHQQIDVGEQEAAAIFERHLPWGAIGGNICRLREDPRVAQHAAPDEDAAVSKKFGVYKQRNLYGKKYMGIERTTFIVDRTGRIAQIYPKVKVEGHVADVLAFLGED